MATGTAIGKIGKIDFFACLPSGTYAFLCLYLAFSFVFSLGEDSERKVDNGKIVYTVKTADAEKTVEFNFSADSEITDKLGKENNDSANEGVVGNWAKELVNETKNLIKITSSEPTSLLLIIFVAYLLGSIFRTVPVAFSEFSRHRFRGFYCKNFVKNHNIEFPYVNSILSQIKYVIRYTNVTSGMEKERYPLKTLVTEIEKIEKIEKILVCKKKLKNYEIKSNLKKENNTCQSELASEGSKCRELMVFFISSSGEYTISGFYKDEESEIKPFKSEPFEDFTGELSEAFEERSKDSVILKIIIELLDWSKERKSLSVFNYWKNVICTNSPEGFAFYQEFEAKVRLFSSMVVSGKTVGVVGIFLLLLVLLPLVLDMKTLLGIAIMPWDLYNLGIPLLFISGLSFYISYRFAKILVRIRRQESEALTSLYLACTQSVKNQETNSDKWRFRVRRQSS